MEGVEAELLSRAADRRAGQAVTVNRVASVDLHSAASRTGSGDGEVILFVSTYNVDTMNNAYVFVL